MKKRYSTFIPGENEISIKTDDTGNFVSDLVAFVVTPGQRRGIWGDKVSSQAEKEKEFLPRISSIVFSRINIYRESSSEVLQWSWL